jgi:hypothetical protein
MELEAVRGVAVGDLGFEVGRQVDDVDGIEGAFLWADTASDTEALGNEGNFGGWLDLNAQLACPHHGTRFLALLSAFLFP